WSSDVCSSDLDYHILFRSMRTTDRRDDITDNFVSGQLYDLLKNIVTVTADERDFIFIHFLLENFIVLTGRKHRRECKDCYISSFHFFLFSSYSNYSPDFGRPKVGFSIRLAVRVPNSLAY